MFAVGVDILRMDRLIRFDAEKVDPFFKKVFTDNELSQALQRVDPNCYFATRFAGKEAVFKSLKINGNRIRLNDIEIINNIDGIPEVTLYGELKQIAKEKGIGRVELSLSFDTDTVIAFAISEA